MHELGNCQGSGLFGLHAVVCASSQPIESMHPRNGLRADAAQRDSTAKVTIAPDLPLTSAGGISCSS
jgi:hypothetical protein